MHARTRVRMHARTRVDTTYATYTPTTHTRTCTHTHTHTHTHTSSPPSQVIATTPFHLITSLIFTSIIYGMAGLRPDLAAIGMNGLLATMMSLIAIQVGGSLGGRSACGVKVEGASGGLMGLPCQMCKPLSNPSGRWVGRCQHLAFCSAAGSAGRPKAGL